MGMGLCPTRASRAREPRYKYNSVNFEKEKNKCLKYWSSAGKGIKSEYVYLITIFITISACEIDKQFSDDRGIEFEFNIGQKFSFIMFF